MLTSLALHLHYKVVEIGMLKGQCQRFTDSIPPVQDQQSGSVGAGLVDALRLEAEQPLNLLWRQGGEDFLFLLEAWDLDARPLPVQVGVDAPEPGVHRYG